MDMRISSCVWTAPAHSCPEWKGRDQFRLREGRWGGEGGREQVSRSRLTFCQPHLLRPHQASYGFVIASVWQGLVTLALPNDIWAE